MAVENFTTYTEVDEGGDITVTASKCDVDTMRRDALSYVRKDMGAGHFGDFEHLVTCRMTAAAQDGQANIWGMSNGSNTDAALATNNDGMRVCFYQGAVNYVLILADWVNAVGDPSVPLVLGTIYYLTIRRSGTDLTCEIYDDSDRTNLIDTLAVACSVTTFRYIFGLMSEDLDDSGDATITCYSENLELKEGIYYFNAYTIGVWTNPDNMVDGYTGTYGTTSNDGDTQVLTGNTCDGTDLGTISTVEIRAYGYGDADDKLELTPVFTGGDGDLHSAAPGTSPVWSAWYDITSDTNAPSPWTWSAVQSLDFKVIFTKAGKANTMHCAKVEIRVTYTPAVARRIFVTHT